MNIIHTKPITPDDLLAMPDGKNFELVNGELVERNVSVLSSLVEGNVFGVLFAYCRERRLGPLFTSSNGIRCFPNDPERICRPDVSFVKAERFSSSHWKEGFLTIAPDLVVEVVSPNDLAGELNEKVEKYLAAGIPLIWVINPKVRTVVIYRGDGTIAKLRPQDELSGENIIPGFRCPVAELFPADAPKEGNGLSASDQKS
jgi:Uma2 family endonuclease